jgi:transcriptional regulator GlxA family with amidase domain
MPQRTVLILLFAGVQSLDVSDPVEVLAAAEQHTPGAYRIRTAPLDGPPAKSRFTLT